LSCPPYALASRHREISHTCSSELMRDPNVLLEPHDLLDPSSSRYGFRQKLGIVLGPFLFVTIPWILIHAGESNSAAWAGGIVGLMACWWITEPIPIWGTALLPILLFPITGSTPLHGLILQYFDPVNVLFLGGMWIAASMQQWGLHRRIALGIVSRIGSSPRQIVLGFMIATAFVSLWISNTATAMMMFPIGMAVVRKFEEQTSARDPRLRRFGLALTLGIAYAASIGGIGTKIGTGTNLVFVKQAGLLLGAEIDFFTWLKMALPVAVVSIPLVWWYLVRYAAPLPSEPLEQGVNTINEARSALGRMSRGEAAALAGFLSAAFLWIFRKDIELGAFTIPGWWRLVTFSWADVLGRPLSSLPAPLPNLLSDVGDGAVAITIGCSSRRSTFGRCALRCTCGTRAGFPGAC
jgi:solute carrier family 13 (sodium-dependent dicarboxylate transporter), member 2/3/5